MCACMRVFCVRAFVLFSVRVFACVCMCLFVRACFRGYGLRVIVQVHALAGANARLRACVNACECACLHACGCECGRVRAATSMEGIRTVS